MISAFSQWSSPILEPFLIIRLMFPSYLSPKLDHLPRAPAALTLGPSLTSMSEALRSAPQPAQDYDPDINTSAGTNTHTRQRPVLTSTGAVCLHHRLHSSGWHHFSPFPSPAPWTRLPAVWLPSCLSPCSTPRFGPF